MPTIEPFWREWRELGAARRLVLAVAGASAGPLLRPDADDSPASCRAAAVCDAAQRRFERLASPPGPDDAPPVPHLRSRLSRLARACGSADREGRDRLLNTAFLLWEDAVGRGRLREKLERRAEALAGPDGAKWLQRVVKDVLWEAEAGDGVATRQRRRNWKGVRAVSLEILPDRDRDGERCTLEHFAAVAERIKETRPHDRNLPRTPEAVGELFYLFCSCCVGAADPRLPGHAGLARACGPGTAERDADGPEEAGGAVSDPEADETAKAMEKVAPIQAAAMLAALKSAIAALPLRDQVVLSSLFRDFDVLSREAKRLAKRAYPALDARAVENEDRTAVVLGVSRRELDDDRRRMEEWFGGTSRGLWLRHGLPPAEGAE